MTTAEAEPRTHKAMRRESDRRIIEAAIEAFADRGYHRTTLAQIGAAAGFTGALISSRFGSKAGLVRAVLRHILGRLTPVGRNRGEGSWIDPDESATDQLGAFIDSYLQDATQEPTRIRALYVLIGESLGGLDEIDDEVAAVNQLFREHVARYVALGQETGEFASSVDPQRSATVIVGGLRGVVTQLLMEPGLSDPEALAVELRRSLITPLLASPDRGAPTVSTAEMGNDEEHRP